MSSLNDQFSIKKCEHCLEWTNGNKAFSENCGEILDLEYRKERSDKLNDFKSAPFLINWFEINGSNRNPIYFIFEKLIRGGQLILMLILAFISLILLILPG
jgi:predicted nucleic acid-binding Zn ribbon protein